MANTIKSNVKSYIRILEAGNKESGRWGGGSKRQKVAWSITRYAPPRQKVGNNVW